ncbi:hypothetical protein LJR175_008181 [Variovorax sp. LjRoot175]|uniref:hypothetical protein n=1 Tax=Variovorax sp. LjRoot175 TaxID=3342276 RepID=UPI003ECFF2B4
MRELFIIVPLVMLALLVAWIISDRLKLRKERGRDYQWYLGEHPGALKNGRVHCHNCGSPRLSVQRLMNRTFLRSHVCGQCGTTLYHSKE